MFYISENTLLANKFEVSIVQELSQDIHFSIGICQIFVLFEALNMVGIWRQLDIFPCTPS